MAQRVAAVFASREAAACAVDALAALGVDREQISTLGPGEQTPSTALGAARDVVTGETLPPTSAATEQTGDPTGERRSEAAGVEAILAGTAAGAVAGLGAGALLLLVPGFGPVLAAGGAVIAALAAGIPAALAAMGIQHHETARYEEQLRGGNIVLSAVIPDGSRERVFQVLEQCGAEDFSITDEFPTGRHTSAAAAGTATIPH